MPDSFAETGTVVTIGVFDGVHRGHQLLISKAVDTARELGVPCVVMTFDPHPAEVVRPGTHPPQLTTLTRRAELAEELGIDVFCVMPFTPALEDLYLPYKTKRRTKAQIAREAGLGPLAARGAVGQPERRGPGRRLRRRGPRRRPRARADPGRTGAGRSCAGGRAAPR